MDLFGQTKQQWRSLTLLTVPEAPTVLPEATKSFVSLFYFFREDKMPNSSTTNGESSLLERGEGGSSNPDKNKKSPLSYYGSTTIQHEKDSLLTANSASTGDATTSFRRQIFDRHMEALSKIPLRRVALDLSLYVNLLITLVKFVAYIKTFSLSVLAALLDSVLDVVSQFVLNYTEKHSSLQRSSAFYPAGAARLEPIGVLTCAALMGMGSFEVLKESGMALVTLDNPFDHATRDGLNLGSVCSMSAIVVVKLLLLMLCQRAAEVNNTSTPDIVMEDSSISVHGNNDDTELDNDSQSRLMGGESTLAGSSKAIIQMSDPTLEALAQDHWNDALSNAVAAGALLVALKAPGLWFLDPVGAICISFYIIWSWFETGKEQIEQLTGKSAPEDFLEELLEIATHFDER